MALADFKQAAKAMAPGEYLSRGKLPPSARDLNSTFQNFSLLALTIGFVGPSPADAITNDELEFFEKKIRRLTGTF